MRAVGAVIDDQYLTLLADRAAEHRLDGIAAAALQQDGGIVGGRGRQGGEVTADRFDHTMVVVIVPGTAIEEHRTLYAG